MARIGVQGEREGDMRGVHRDTRVHACVLSAHAHTDAWVSAQPWVQGMHTLTPSPVFPSLPAPFWGTHSPKARSL